MNVYYRGREAGKTRKNGEFLEFGIGFGTWKWGGWGDNGEDG
jgi:hypothetical protein